MVQQAPPAIVRELEAIEQQLASRYGSHDCEGWGALLGDEWTVTHITGEVIAKVQAIDMCKAAPRITSTYDQLSYRAYGDMAIVSGRTTARAETEPPITVVLRFTDVFVKRDGKWLVVASHATQIPK